MFWILAVGAFLVLVALYLFFWVLCVAARIGDEEARAMWEHHAAL